jgi:hypothetical protein
MGTLNPGAAGDLYTTTEICNPGGHVLTDTNTLFSDLQTRGGPISTTQGSTHLSGGPVTETAPRPDGQNNVFTFAWTFDADVP